jgi:hypothetical protein
LKDEASSAFGDFGHRSHTRPQNSLSIAEQREITVGDVAHIKAGERQWHGAKADTALSHITITIAGSKPTPG